MIARLLVEHGANVNLLNHRGMTTLHMAAWGGILNKYKCIYNQCNSIKKYELNTDSEKIAKLLIDYGVNVNVSDKDGNSALHLAARYGKLIGFETNKT